MTDPRPGNHICILALACCLVALTSCHLKGDRKEQRKNQTGDDQKHTNQSASGGVIDGNGGEYIQNEHNPWFVGKAPVPYCVSKSDDISLSAAEASQQIASAFAEWRHLLSTLQFDGISHSDPIHGLEIPTRYLALDFEEVDCEAAPPLEFKLGVFDDAVQSALKYSAAMTVGFALRTSYDDVSGTAHGFIWISPDRGPNSYQGPKISEEFWKQPQLFRNVILHEIGHIIGFQHIGMSLMDAQMPAKAVERGYDSSWKGEEFSAEYRSANGFCGVIQYADSAALSEILQLQKAEGASVCLKWRGDLQGSDDNTPVQLQINDGNGGIKERLVKMSEGSTTDTWLVGIFSEKNASGVSTFKRTWFGSIVTQALYRGKIEHEGGEAQPIELDMAAPGAFVLRVPLKVGWQTISIVPLERRDNLLKLYKLLAD